LPPGTIAAKIAIVNGVSAKMAKELLKTGRRFGVIAACFLAKAAFGAEAWPPPDPDAELTQKIAEPSLVSEFRDIRRFAQAQEALGSPGKIVERRLDADQPFVVYHWRMPNGAAEARVWLFKTGDFGGLIGRKGEAPTIIFNNFGALVCNSCAPPVNVCGRRPSWVPHDVHWDNFDCRCTLTGPAGAPELGC
jgi:hypothetical protein